jgi:hypothetical protein
MKISWISLLLACSAAVSAHEEDEDVEVSALQFCAFNEVRKADLCLAVTSAKNSTTGKNDLSMHLSVVFVDRMGWASVGIGEKMAGSLMFFIYPGVADGGKFSSTYIMITCHAGCLSSVQYSSEQC